MAYDIFISYRRKGAGAGVAGELQSKFENLGYKVFLDVDEIGSGQFPIQIKQAIEQCNDFLLVLSPGTLDRCVDEEDWVRKEIIMAQNLNKNIVGVGLPGFVMPEAEDLPKVLESLATRQVFVWTHEYRAASFAKIEENLVSTQLKKKKKRQKKMVLSPVILALITVGILLLVKKPVAEEVKPKELVGPRIESQMFDYHVNRAMNLTHNLPDTNEFKSNFLQLVSDSKPFARLMEGIAEYDSALMLKNQYENLIIDNYDVEAKRDVLLDYRKSYLNTIMVDVKVLIDEGGAMFAQQDMDVARLLALQDEKQKLDSIDAIIESSLTK